MPITQILIDFSRWLWQPRPAKYRNTSHSLQSSIWISLLLTIMLCGRAEEAQEVPRSVDKPWIAPDKQWQSQERFSSAKAETPIDAGHTYSLAELVDLAESSNPQTRSAWESAKIRAADLRIAKSELYPALTGVMLGQTDRQRLLLDTTYARQTIGLYQPTLEVSYLLLDFGGRAGRIKEARQQLLQADYAFNANHLAVFYEVTHSYLKLLEALGQRHAAELDVEDAQTVQSSIEDKLKDGLATLPNVLQARAETAHAQYTLSSVEGKVDVARGELLSTVGSSPLQPLEVEDLDSLQQPEEQGQGAQAYVERGLGQRPEIGEELAKEAEARAKVGEMRSAYFPSISFKGEGGEGRAYAQQDLLPGVYFGPAEVWKVQVGLRWTLFDGLAREARVAEAHAEEQRARADAQQMRNLVELQIWTAFIDLRTALKQRDAATASLHAAEVSYDATVDSLKAGLSTTLDLVSAQRILAQARSNDVTAKTNVLEQVAKLAYRTGDLLNKPIPGKVIP